MVLCVENANIVMRKSKHENLSLIKIKHTLF